MLKTSMIHFKTKKNFNTIESLQYYSPFSWFTEYKVFNESFHNWNIFVEKMFKLKLQFIKLPVYIKQLVVYDGPDYNSKQYNASENKIILFTSFQCSVIFQGFIYPNEIDMAFQITTLKKYKIPNYKNILITNQLMLQKLKRKTIQAQQFLHAYKFLVQRHFHINITISSFNFSGSNTGYCKYGGISIYDESMNKYEKLQEVLLLCNTTISFVASQSIVSFGSTLYLVIYSYSAQDDIDFNVVINPTVCQGIEIKR